MIELKSERQIDEIRKACAVVAKVLREVSGVAKKGTKTVELDALAKRLILESGGRPAFFKYKGFPANICVSINEEVVHGIPSERRIEAGDLVSVDLGVELNGFFGDAAVTFAVGKAGKKAKALIDTTKEALHKGIDAARAGNRLGDVSNAIQVYAERNGFSVVKDLVGHGVGFRIHEDPQVPNFGEAGKGVRLKEGMVLAIEPMINAGALEVETLDDGWTVVTKDRALSAHFEHTIAITKNGTEILT
ncbi:MAG: type I methionyl aminopeptidase [Candidatus Omnitrophica bacterium CG1_02_49_10]|nr:MAG: type I methionyl aminopeptidase [Candidatus Omnitrophica bacterium CG1_02_49_10]